MAVVSGEYNVPGWSRLVEAEAEASTLSSLYAAASVDARTVAVLDCLDGRPPADLLHFAVHGIYDPNSTLNGLVLADGQPLDPLQVRAYVLARQPFVFLNACQVGSSQRILGDYAGIAEAFLFSGAAAVVAPLWSIKDTIAREIALRFYEQAFAGVAPAEALRRERAAFRDSADSVSATCLAYLYYGHPSLLLRRESGGTDA
jgi:CHAT domain-containing protein